MAKITNSLALEALSMLRRSGIEGFDRIPIDPASQEIPKAQANLILRRLSWLGKPEGRQEIDPTDLQAVNSALQGRKQPTEFFEQRVVNLASEFQSKFGVTIPVRLSNGKLWEPRKTGNPSEVDLFNLEKALEVDRVTISGLNSKVIVFNSRYNDRILAFLQGAGLTQRDGLVITHIQPEDVREIRADFRYMANTFEDFKVDQKTVIYQISYYDKDYRTKVTREVEVKPEDVESKNGYLKELALKTRDLVQPQLIKK